MEQHLFELLDVLVKYNTESPLGRNTDPLQDDIEQLLKTLNLDIQRGHLYESDSVIVVTLKGEDEDVSKLILNDHVDVANVDDDSSWQYLPSQLTEKEGWLYGRGVSDMKGGMVLLFYVLEKSHQEGRQPGGDIVVQSVVGEEVGEAGTKRACEVGPQTDLALVLDTSENMALGQGGVIIEWITAKSKNTTYDGACSQTIHADEGLFGASAAEKMTEITQALSELEQHWAVMKYSLGMPPGVNTINPVVIERGRHPAFIVGECRLWITVYYLPNESYEDVIKEIEAYLNRVVDVGIWLRENPSQFEWGGELMVEDKGEIFPSFAIPSEYPGFKQLQDAHYRVHHSKMKHGMSITVTDGGWTAHFDISIISYGPGSLEEAHNVDEEIESQELRTYSDVLYTFLKR